MTQCLFCSVAGVRFRVQIPPRFLSLQHVSMAAGNLTTNAARDISLHDTHGLVPRVNGRKKARKEAKKYTQNCAHQVQLGVCPRCQLFPLCPHGRTASACPKCRTLIHSTVQLNRIDSLQRIKKKKKNPLHASLIPRNLVKNS